MQSKAKQEKLTAWLSKCRDRIAHHYCKKSANGLDEQLIEVNTHIRPTSIQVTMNMPPSFCPLTRSPAQRRQGKLHHNKKKEELGYVDLYNSFFVFDQLIRAVALCRSVFFSTWAVCRSVFFVFLWVCRRQNHLPPIQFIQD